MNLNEPNVALRTVKISLVDATNARIPLNTTFQVGDFKVLYPDGTVHDPVLLPTMLENAPIAGEAQWIVGAAEVAELGVARLYAITGTARNLGDGQRWDVDITADAAAVWQTPRSGNQPSGSFGEYLDAAISGAVRAMQSAPPIQAAVSTELLQIIQGDLDEPLSITLRDLTGTPVDVSDATGALTLHWRKPDGTVVDVTLTNVALNLGQVKRTWSSGDTAMVGQHSAQVIVPRAAGQQTFPKDGSVYLWFVHPRL